MPMPTALTLLVPGALPPAPLLPQLLDRAALPTLNRLLAAGTIDSEAHDDPWLRSDSAERWLAAVAGIPVGADGAIAAAPWLYRADHGATAGADLVCIEPVHLHVARDHLQLVNPAALALRADEAAALLAAAAPALAGLTVDARHPQRWYLSEPTFARCTTTAPARAAGHSIDVWMPASRDVLDARAWRRLQNEIQMLWHDHPVNAARAAAGQLPVNSVWLHGGHPGSPAPTTPWRFSAAALDGDWPLLAGAAAAQQTPLQRSERFDPTTFASATGERLAGVATLRDAALAGDWHSWRAQVQQLEQQWLAPALAALRAGRLPQLTLVLGGESRWLSATIKRADLLRFWRRRAPLPALLAAAGDDE